MIFLWATFTIRPLNSLILLLYETICSLTALPNVSTWSKLIQLVLQIAWMSRWLKKMNQLLKTLFCSYMEMTYWRNIPQDRHHHSTNQSHHLCVIKCAYGPLVQPITAGRGWLNKMNLHPCEQSSWEAPARSLSLQHLTWLDVNGGCDGILPGLKLMMTEGTQGTAWICHLI